MNKSNLNNPDIRKRTILDKLKYYFICRRKGHSVRKLHPKYPSQYCYVCNKHRSQFYQSDKVNFITKI